MLPGPKDAVPDFGETQGTVVCSSGSIAQSVSRHECEDVGGIMKVSYHALFEETIVRSTETRIQFPTPPLYVKEHHAQLPS